MIVIYAFFEGDVIRVPFFHTDKRLFNLFLAQGGEWDNAAEDDA